MWNQKGEDDVNEETPDREPTSRGTPERPQRQPASGEAVIGDSIRIQGEVTGDEDLTIQGYVDGSVELEDHSLTVGSDGEVEADVTARVITVEGEVTGDLHGEEQVVVRSTARVRGDISAPRVVLEDGAHFRGGVEMEDGGSAGFGSEPRGSGLPAGAKRASGDDEASEEPDDSAETRVEDEAADSVAA